MKTAGKTFQKSFIDSTHELMTERLRKIRTHLLYLWDDLEDLVKGIDPAVWDDGYYEAVLQTMGIIRGTLDIIYIILNCNKTPDGVMMQHFELTIKRCAEDFDIEINEDRIPF